MMKKCVACAEEIQSAALLCRHCRTDQRDQKYLSPPSASGAEEGSNDPAAEIHKSESLTSEPTPLDGTMIAKKNRQAKHQQQVPLDETQNDEITDPKNSKLSKCRICGLQQQENSKECDNCGYAIQDRKQPSTIPDRVPAVPDDWRSFMDSITLKRKANEKESTVPQRTEGPHNRSRPPSKPEIHKKPSKSKSQEEIVAFLRQFPAHTELTCLICGYKGLVGVRRKASTTTIQILAFLIILPTSLLFGTGFVYGALFGFVLMLVIKALVPHPLVCPNCENELKRTRSFL